MLFFFFKQKTAYEIEYGLVGSEMCIRDRFPVVTPGIEYPWCIERVSIIQAIVCEPVLRSGAGISRFEPSSREISVVNRRVRR